MQQHRRRRNERCRRRHSVSTRQPSFCHQLSSLVSALEPFSTELTDILSHPKPCLLDPRPLHRCGSACEQRPRACGLKAWPVCPCHKSEADEERRHISSVTVTCHITWGGGGGWGGSIGPSRGRTRRCACGRQPCRRRIHTLKLSSVFANSTLLVTRKADHDNHPRLCCTHSVTVPQSSVFITLRIFAQCTETLAGTLGISGAAPARYCHPQRTPRKAACGRRE